LLPAAVHAASLLCHSLLHFQFFSAIKREGKKQDSQISGKLKIKICTAILKSFSTTLLHEKNITFCMPFNNPFIYSTPCTKQLFCSKKIRQ
jgi:hypothetical protein